MELVLDICDKMHTLLICDDHHAMIKKEVETYNLSHLIVQKETDIYDILERALEGSFREKDDFDPLLMMDFILWRRAIRFREQTGIDFSVKDGQPACILCQCEQHDESVETWLLDAIDLTVKESKRLGFFSVQ